MENAETQQQPGLILALENLSQDGYDLVMADLHERQAESSLVQLITMVTSMLRESDVPLTRLVVTGDFVASVNIRDDRTGNEFTMDRGAGIVAAKTMPPNDQGIVDILVPAYWLLPLEAMDERLARDDLIQHTAAHEAVHASLHHNGNEPFDLHHREELGYATANFVSMASEQVEEHLAEYLSSQRTGRTPERSADDVRASIEAWQQTLSLGLPAIAEDDPDYFQKGMVVSFNALHILWKTIAYLAAALRHDNRLDAVPDDILQLHEWDEFIGPWWDRYVELLLQIPMTVDVDVPATDEVVRELAAHLQRWADELGFDFHDTSDGGFFRIKLYD